MAFSFIPVTIASLRGVEGADAGGASGLVNTSRQIGGALGLAAVSAIAATSTGNYLESHTGVTAGSPIALDHGFRTALYALIDCCSSARSSRPRTSGRARSRARR